MSNVTSPPVLCSPSVPDRVPTQRKQVKQSGQKHEISNRVSSWPATSVVGIHGPTPAALPVVLQHLPAVSASAPTLPCFEGGESTCFFTNFTHKHASLCLSRGLYWISVSVFRFLTLVRWNLEHLCRRFSPTSSLVCTQRWDTTVGHQMVCFRAASTACRYFSLHSYSDEKKIQNSLLNILIINYF